MNGAITSPVSSPLPSPVHARLAPYPGTVLASASLLAPLPLTGAASRNVGSAPERPGAERDALNSFKKQAEY